MKNAETIVDFFRDLPRPGVLCTIIKVSGSIPQQLGAKMWVCRDRFFGTVGGGAMEKQVLEHARGMIQERSCAPVTRSYDLTEKVEMACGGKAEVFFEPFARRKTLTLFGGGHVGRAAAQVFVGMPMDVVVVDGRPEWADKAAFPDGVEVVCMDPLEYAKSKEWGPDDAACVFTHSHDVDFPIGAHLLDQPLGFLGMIGSKNKARAFRGQFIKGGGGSEEREKLWDSRMHCPIGIPLHSKNPKVIAVSVAAQVLDEWGLKEAEKKTPAKRK